MTTKTILESKKAKMTFIGMGIIVLSKLGGHFIGIPSVITDVIVDAVTKLCLGAVAAQGLADVANEYKNNHVDLGGE